MAREAVKRNSCRDQKDGIQSDRQKGKVPAERVNRWSAYDGGEGGSVETRMGPDGEHEVPPPSAEEVAAELAEQRAAGVPAAEFSAGES